MRAVSLALVVVALAGAACGVQLLDYPGRACDDAHPCREGRSCVDGTCWSPDEVDASVQADAGATDAGPRDAGTPDAGDAGPRPLWQQRLHGFTGTSVDPSCLVDIDPARANRVVATISSADDGSDTAEAHVDTPARLPTGAYGHLRGRVTLPAPLALRGKATFASLSAPAGDWLRLAFDDQGQLVVASDAQTLGAQPLVETFARDGGFAAGDYVLDVSWDRPGARVVTLDGVVLASTPAPSGGSASPPTALRLGVLDYAGDAGTGWTVTLSGWELADDPSAPLEDTP